MLQICTDSRVKSEPIIHNGSNMISEFDGKDAFDEIFPYPGIVKAIFVFRGQQGEVFHKGTGKESQPLFHGYALFIVNLDPFYAAGGGIAFENIAAKSLRFKSSNAGGGPVEHLFRHIFPGSNGDQSRRFRAALQLYGFPGDRHAAFHLRAYGDEIHIFAQGIPNEAVQSVVAIVTDVLSQKTRADTQFDSVFQAAFLSLPLC